MTTSTLCPGLEITEIDTMELHKSLVYSSYIHNKLHFNLNKNIYLVSQIEPVVDPEAEVK